MMSKSVFDHLFNPRVSEFACVTTTYLVHTCKNIAMNYLSYFIINTILFSISYFIERTLNIYLFPITNMNSVIHYIQQVHAGTQQMSVCLAVHFVLGAGIQLPDNIILLLLLLFYDR